MSVLTEMEPDAVGFWGMERCCFCRTQTSHWTTQAGKVTGGSVACCPKCALVAEPADVPTKAEWCRRETIAMGRRP